MTSGMCWYNNPVPPELYKCTRCPQTGVKLWRRRERQTPLCIVCVIDTFIQQHGPIVQLDQTTFVTIIGVYELDSELSSLTEWFIPAVPQPGGFGFFMDHETPLAAANGWRNLPTSY